MTDPLRVEATGETVGEAKWHALRELEQLAPGLDKASVQFEVVSEGQRGLLGVGYAPARVVAVAEQPSAPPASSPAPPERESELAASVRELLDRVTTALGVIGRVGVTEDEEAVTASVAGDDLGLLIGRHGQTLDAIQYLANVIAWRSHGDDRKDVVVDAAGYRERRRATLESLAERTADRVRATGEPAELEPMTSVERRIVHLCLKNTAGVGTRSEGEEPYRYVVVEPRSS